MTRWPSSWPLVRLVSWNVNGLRACMKKGFLESCEALGADVYCLQETKIQEGQVELELPGYHIPPPPAGPAAAGRE